MSYISDESVLVKNVLIISNINEADTNSKIYHHLLTIKIKKMKYIDFEIWFTDLIQNDDIYMNNNYLYGFRFIFFKESWIWENKNIYPIYPWNINFKNMYMYSNNIINEELRIIKLKKTIYNLKKKIYLFKKYRLYNVRRL